MTEPYFNRTREGYAPTPEARGPWSPDMLHGRLLGGLAAIELEHAFGGPEWRATRLTVDMFRPAAMKPVQVEVTAIREGRRVRVADAVLTCDGHQVCRTTAVFLHASEEPPGNVWEPARATWPDPETLPVPDDDTGASENDGWLFRTVDGGFNSGKHSRVWTNETLSLVDDDELTPLARAAVSGDLACPIANSSDDGLYFINADYTMMISRYPVGGWVGLEVSERMSADGLSIASALLVDEQGPFATSGGTSLARPKLDLA